MKSSAVIGYQSRQDGAVLPARDYNDALQEKCFLRCSLSHIIDPLLSKLIRSRLLDIGLELVDLVSVQKHEKQKQELGQYPAIS